MSIFNWHKKKDEEQKKQVLEPKKTAVAVSAVPEIVLPKSSKEIVTADISSNVPETVSVKSIAYRVLLRPLITEKNTLHQTQNQYVFEIARRANKIEVRKAVEAAFKVKVKKVRLVNQRGKVKQFGRRQGVRKFWKKAIVTVGKGDQITLLSSV